MRLEEIIVKTERGRGEERERGRERGEGESVPFYLLLS
jgi:hypothetical protein